MTDKNDSYVAGLNNWTTTFSGTWDPVDLADAHLQASLIPPLRNVTLVTKSRRLFWIDWWAERHHFTAKVVKTASIAADGISCEFQPVSVSRVERSEWWRRAGFAVIGRLPLWVCKD